ncbi:MAG: hypothetical protein LBT00_07280 [Spirochaetaceae bacterium]|jgi:hypothetical protein|nr:hypothetical protein [Spirochaetaceae bacterium]
MGLLYKSDSSADGRKGDPQKTAVAPGRNAEKEIAAYIARYPKLSGVVFDIPHGVTKEDAEILSGLIKSAVSSIGIAARLRSDSRLTGTLRMLVLTPASLDKKLVLHRIRANFQIKNGVTFSATDLNDIKTVVKNYGNYSAAVIGGGASFGTPSGAVCNPQPPVSGLRAGARGNLPLPTQ